MALTQNNIDNFIQYLVDNHIVTLKNNKFRVISIWKNSSRVSDEAKDKVNEFISGYRTEKEAWFCLGHHILEIPKCPICGNLAKFNEKGYNLTCGNCNYNDYGPKKEKVKLSTTEESKKRGRIKYEETCLKRYGKKSANQFITEDKKKAYIKDCQKKYGSNNAGQSKEAKEKREKTMLSRYGVKHNFSLSNTSEHAKKIWDKNHDKILEKIKNTCNEKYGTEYYFQSEEFKSKSKDTLENKYGSVENSYNQRNIKSEKTKELRHNNKNYNNVNKIKETIKNRLSKFEIENSCTRVPILLEKYGQGWYNELDIPFVYDGRYRFIENKYLPEIIKYSSEYHNIGASSNEEKELLSFIKTLTNEEILENKKSIIKDNNHNYELDIYIPALHLAFEFNGDFWHSTINVSKNYHQIKTKLCYENKIQLIHIYEFQWKENKELIKQRLRKLFNHEDCSEFNWVSVDEYDKYKLEKPSIIHTCFNNKGQKKYDVYDEGKFIKIKTNE